MNKIERIICWTVGIVLGIPFTATIFLLLVSMSYDMYTGLTESGECW